MCKISVALRSPFPFFCALRSCTPTLAVHSGAQMRNSGIYYQKLNLIIIQYFLFQMGVHQEENEKRDEVI